MYKDESKLSQTAGYLQTSLSSCVGGLDPVCLGSELTVQSNGSSEQQQDAEQEVPGPWHLEGHFSFKARCECLPLLQPFLAAQADYSVPCPFEGYQALGAPPPHLLLVTLPPGMCICSRASLSYLFPQLQLL